jgi:protein-L-isoaspartate(D-aspartate) O-methyltransferase
MQGLALDGSRVRKLSLSVRVRTQGVQERLDPQSGPRFAVTFYDENRRELTTRWLGPWTGDTPWRQVSEEIAVPRNAREAIARIGLFGATGVAEFDEVRIAGERSPD